MPKPLENFVGQNCPTFYNAYNIKMLRTILQTNVFVLIVECAYIVIIIQNPFFNASFKVPCPFLVIFILFCADDASQFITLDVRRTRKRTTMAFDKVEQSSVLVIVGSKCCFGVSINTYELGSSCVTMMF